MECNAYFDAGLKIYPCGLYLMELEKIKDTEDMASDFSKFGVSRYISGIPTLIRADLEELSNAWENGMKRWYIEHRIKCPDLKGYFPKESPSLDEKLAEY